MPAARMATMTMAAMPMIAPVPMPFFLGGGGAKPPDNIKLHVVEPTDAPRIHVPGWLAALQVFVISGIPTQIVVATVLMLGLRLDPFGPDGLMNNLSLEFIATLMFVDTALVAILIRVFLEVSGESWREVLETDLTAAFVLAREAARHMAARGSGPRGPALAGRSARS